MNKIYIHELIGFVLALINTLVLLVIKNTITYEKVPYDEITPKSSCIVIIQHNPYIVYAYMICVLILVFSVLYRIYKDSEKIE